jgi:hypothetical protein
VIGALCSVADHEKKGAAAEKERKDSEEFADIPDSDKLTIRNAPKPKLWTISIGYRYQPSSRHFIGTVEQTQRELTHNQIQNVYNLFDISIERQITRRWSLDASLPVLYATRNQLYAPKAFYTVAGQGDATVGARYWIFKPPTESGGNIQMGINLKIPTGIYNATGHAVDSQGRPVVATADQSIQAGDGRVGFSLDIQAFHPLPFGFMAYFTGVYLFNPADTNGVSTFRRAKGEDVMSVTDQYLYRGGISRAVPGVRGLAITFGGRMEGVPVRDAFGKSDGFRRPGYAIDGDPGFMYARGSYIFSCNIPWAIERNRRRSVSDIANHTHGDAAFADYAVTLGVARRF